MNYTTTAYLIYLPLVLALIIWVSQTLFNHSERFLRDIFDGDKELSASVKHLLRIGFYLLNIGWAVYTLRISAHMETNQAMIESLSLKMGGYIIVLSLVYFLNLFLLFKMRRRVLLN